MSAARRFANRLADLLFLPGSERLWARRLRGRVLCLLYHRVDLATRLPALARLGPPLTTPAELERELGFWKRLGAVFGTFRDLRRGWFPANDEVGIIVSFDDGFRDNYTHGLEVLARLDVRATLFQTSSLVGARQLLWEHALNLRLRDPERSEPFLRLAAEALGPGTGQAGRPPIEDELRFGASTTIVERLLARANAELGALEAEPDLAAALYPDAADLRRALELGHEVGSHGVSHHPRSRLDDAAFERELSGSKERLDELAGETPECYSYPFGSFRPGDDAVCRRHYAQAAIVRAEPIRRDTSPWWLPRATWPGPAKNALRLRRWLLTGRI